MNFPFVRFFFSVLVTALWTRYNSNYLPSGTLLKIIELHFSFLALGRVSPFVISEGLVLQWSFLVIRKHDWPLYVQSVLTGNLGILMQLFLSFYLGWFWLQVTENPNVTGLKHKRKLILSHTSYPVLSWQRRGPWFSLCSACSAHRPWL